MNMLRLSLNRPMYAKWMKDDYSRKLYEWKHRIEIVLQNLVIFANMRYLPLINRLPLITKVLSGIRNL
ncbi:hypothetical protein O3M35_009021 [Rhynocoris fuscipes]|uniref:Uncharacterized protein n=1 Tax=Rhynocoris fuscipes TaxID=488301 RepID=A0AAW1D2U2_9HEMI